MQPSPFELVRSFPVGIQTVVLTDFETVVVARIHDAAIADPIAARNSFEWRCQTSNVVATIALVTE